MQLEQAESVLLQRTETLVFLVAASAMAAVQKIEGARSEITVEMAGSQFELKDHRIPIERQKARGWGKVSIPADVNSADNDFYFVFDRPAVRQTIIVADDANAARPLQLSAAISPPASRSRICRRFSFRWTAKPRLPVPVASAQFPSKNCFSTSIRHA